MFVQRLNIQNQSVKIYGDGLYQAQVHILTSFIIDTYSLLNSNDDIKIITYPLDYVCDWQIINHHNGRWTVNYTPTEIGQIQIDIYLGEKLLNSNPFKINIFDINQIYISNLNDNFINQLVKFNIDTSKAGIGQLDIAIQDGNVSCDGVSHSSSQFEVTFLPNYSGLYKIDIQYNGLPVPGSPFSCYISDLPRMIVSNSITNVQVGDVYSFDIYNPSKSFDVNILAPSERLISFKRIQLNTTHTRIDYILNEIGLHQVNVRSNQNMDVYGSSFSLQAYDINRVIVSDIPRFIIYNQPVIFTIDASKAGEGQLEVNINNGLVANQVKTIGKSKFQFQFIPLLNDPHRISIKFNGQQLSGFPKECQVISSNDIKIHGPSLNQVLCNNQTWFTIDTSHRELTDLQVLIFTPSNQRLHPSTLITSTGLRVDWTPDEIGTYIIHVTLRGNLISGSPFYVKCYDPKKVLVIPPKNDSTIRKPTKFLIDISKAGEGNLEISVNHSGHTIPNELNSIGNNRFEVQFIPQKATIHYCIILFNGELVPGSPFPVNVMENQHVIAIGKGLGSIPINISTSFTVLTQNSVGGDLKCLIKGPDEHLVACIVTKIDANRYEVTYTPDRVGEYHIEILYDHIPIDNSPFISRSFDINKIKIQDFPLTTLIDSATYFLIDATDSGSGNLEIAISRDGKNIPNYVQNEGGARFRIKFIPDQSSIHYIQIKFNGIDIPGSPFICNVYSSDFIFENYEYAPINKPTAFLIKSKLNSLLNPNIYVDIITPSGKQYPGIIEKLTTNSYNIGFIPNEIGDHEIRFYKNEDRKVLWTKFISQVYDISKIRISDLPIAIAHRLYKFTINTTEVGNGVLSVKIKQNENKLSHEQTRISNHIYEISFKPETSDECIVQISFNGEHNLRTLIIPVKNDCEQVQVSSIPSGIVGQPTIFTIDVAELSNLVSVLITESHSGRIVPHTMTSISNTNNRYEISFIPNIARQHTITVSYDGKIVSTYHVDVCNVNKIRVSSINDGIVGIPSVFSVDTHGAGEGHLEVTISDGRRTLPAVLKSVQARKFDIAFLPEISGKHSIIISFNRIPVEGSPFIININDPSISDENSSEEEEEDDDDDHEFLIGGQLQGTKVGEVAWLICETSLTDLYEDLNVFIIDPDEIIIKHTRIQDSAGRWRIEFEPRKSGLYQIQTDIDDTKVNLASMEILPLNYERHIYGERIVHPNVLNFLSIDSPNENLNIQLKDSNDNEIPIEIEKDLSEWKIFFTLIKIDHYQLIITDNNTEQIFNIHCVVEETDLFRNGGIEDIARLIIDHKKISIDNVNVIVKDPLAHTIPAAFYRNLNNDLVIEYIPTRPDNHEIFIRTQNNLLDICPIRIRAFQSNNPFEPVLRVQVKEILEHTFKGVIDQYNKLEISITDPFERTIPFQRTQNERGELTISISPVHVGTHWIRISNDENDSFALLPIFAYDDDYVPLSPVGTPTLKENRENSITESLPVFRELATISETTENSSPSSSGKSLSPEELETTIRNKSPILNIQTLEINDLIDPNVQIISKFSYKDPNDKLNIIIHDANGDNIEYKTEQLSDGRKCISYETAVVGPVEIHILKENQSIEGSPLIVHAFDPSAVHLLDIPKRILVNTTTSFLIQTTHAGKGSLQITIKDSNNQSLPINIQKKSNDQIIIQFQPTVLGIHKISILFNGIPISKTPFEFFVENNEQRGRSIYSKHDLLLLAKQQEKLKLSPSLTVNSPSSKSNENIPQKDLLTTKSEDKCQTNLDYIPFTESEIRQFQLIKEKFEQKQPIDVVFDPRQYPFKIHLPTLAPLIHNDVHFLFDLPHIAYVYVTINELIIPLEIFRKNAQTFLLKFRPIIAGDYVVTLKDFNGQLSFASPYIFPVYNPNGIYIEPFNHLQPINNCHFICNIDNIGKGKFFIMVYYQSKPIRISYRVTYLSKTRLQISLLPLKIGTYRIYFAHRNFPINGTPIDITVYDIEKISIIPEHHEPVIVKTTVAYKVNTSQAGQGELKAELIQPLTSILPCRCHVEELNKQEYIIEYIPNEPGQYQLRIFFNNQLLQGKIFSIDVYSLLPSITKSTFPIINIQKLSPNHSPQIGDKICLQIITDKTSLHAQILCNGRDIPCQIQQTKDKHIWHLKFQSFVVGNYQIYLFHNGLSMMNSPYLIQVKDMDGKNQLSGLTNTPCEIKIHTKFTSSSQMRAVVLLDTIQIPSRIEILDHNFIQINFTPQQAGLYFLHIYNNNQSIEGSPFLIHIKPKQGIEISGKCLDRLRSNDLGIFRIHCHGQQGIIKVNIFNLSIDQHSNNYQLISFQLLETYEKLKQFPKEILQTSLTILLTARLRLTQERIQNLILEEEENGHAVISFQLYEISSQLPTNEQIINVLKNLINKQTLNLIAPNHCLLHTIHESLVINPKGEPINVKLFPLPNGDYMGEFTPKKIGQHRFDVTFNGIPIEGSPFFTEVYDPSQVKIGSLTKDMILGIENTFEIDTNNAGNVPLEVNIISPSGINVPCKIDELFKIKKVHFIPTEIGIHHLNAKFGSDIIPGTPMEIMVNNTRIITAYGDGLHSGLYEKITTFMIDTKNMDGDLQIRIENSNSIIKNILEKITESLYKVTYIPNEIGFVNISIKWNGKDIINSPFKASITNPERVRIIGNWKSILDSQNRMCVTINEENKISFNTSHAGPGILKADIRDANNDSIPLHLDQENSVYILRFTIPREGKYNLIITYANHVLPNMPIQIIANLNNSSSSASKVICSGDGLRMGIIGNESKCLIDTRNAKPGELTAYCQGIHKTAFCRLFDHQNGMFTLFIKPEEIGKHLLTIKYNGEHVPGSPYTVKVSGPPDARKVKVYGPGIEHGVLSTFQSNFICETKGAGAGQLTVQIHGPKGAFRVEMYRKNLQDRTITCRYNPTEPGDYLISIKWSGEHVYGSPFHTRIFECQEELDQFQYELNNYHLFAQ